MKIRLLHPTMIVVCTSFLFISFCHAQKEAVSNKNVIQLQGKHYRDSIVLRWGYTDAKLWYKMLKQPVKVYRRNVSQNGKYEAIAEIMPWDSTKIEATTAKNTNPPDQPQPCHNNVDAGSIKTGYTSNPSSEPTFDNAYKRA